MRHHLHVPFLDARAEGLRWALTDEVQAPEALCARTVRRGGLDLELRILGASHAVVARPPGHDPVAEVVACGAPAGQSLPLTGAVADHGGLRWRTDAGITRPPGGLGVLADRLRALEAAEPDVLLAAFPGSPDALTVVRPAPRRAAWTTWHLYPATGEAVRTSTALSRTRGTRRRSAG